MNHTYTEETHTHRVHSVGDNFFIHNQQVTVTHKLGRNFETETGGDALTVATDGSERIRKYWSLYY